MRLFGKSLIRGYQQYIWVSELLSRALVAVYVGILLFMLGLLWLNHTRLNEVEKRIAEEKKIHLVLADRADSLDRRYRIYQGIRHLQGNRFDPPLAELLTEIVAQNSERFGYDPFILLAVINVESAFEEDAKGRYRNGKLSGAFGLMQLKFETAQLMADRLGIQLRSPNDLFCPEINIPLGIYYLTRMVVKFESLPLGVLAYNQGPGSLWKRMRGEIPFSEVYYHKVMKSYYRLKKEIKPIEVS